MQLTLAKLVALTSWLQLVSALPVTDQSSQLQIVKTTTTASGQVIDWVVRESQGKIATPPTKQPSSKNKPIHNDSDEVGPEGTVPIARSKGKKLANTSLPHNNTISPAAADSYAGVHWYASSGQAVNNFGGLGSFSMFDAYVESSSDFSLLQTAVIRSNVPVAAGGTTSQTVEAGWINYPDQIASPHLFSFYTTNGYSADGDNIGGWNRDQAGWVQVDSTVYPGYEFSTISADGGTQYDLDIEYYLNGGNWWLSVNGVWIGYYPATLFTNGVDSSDTLETMSDQIDFYGEIFNSEDAMTTTDMGSGEFPSAGSGKAGYIHNIQYTDTSNTNQNYDGSAQIIISDSSRYDMAQSFNSGGSWGSYFYLGGPGAGGVVGG